MFHGDVELRLVDRDVDQGVAHLFTVLGLDVEASEMATILVNEVHDQFIEDIRTKLLDGLVLDVNLDNLLGQKSRDVLILQQSVQLRHEGSHVGMDGNDVLTISGGRNREERDGSHLDTFQTRECVMVVGPEGGFTLDPR